jgi:hypothetical protein
MPPARAVVLSSGAMLAGHYAAAFVGKAAEPRLPWWVLCVSAQLVDILHWVLLLLGRERSSLDFSLPSNPLVIEHVPYTHSLVGNALWALLAGVIAYALFSSFRATLTVALVVLSHWFLDLLMHRPDLTLYGRPPRYGLGLWNAPAIAHGVELGTLLMSVVLYLGAVRPKGGSLRAALSLALFLLIVQVYSIVSKPPATLVAIALSCLTFMVITTALAAWLDARTQRAR